MNTYICMHTHTHTHTHTYVLFKYGLIAHIEKIDKRGLIAVRQLNLLRIQLSIGHHAVRTTNTPVRPQPTQQFSYNNINIVIFANV